MSLIHRYILKGKIPVPCPDLLTWGRWMESADRKVAHSEKDGVVVSTVFLGLNHQWGDGPPILFETMVFGGPCDGFQERYPTWEKAELGHHRACWRARVFTLSPLKKQA